MPNWPTERPPQPLPARDVKFPPYQIRTLPNGLQVIAVSHHEQPAVSVRLIVRAGSAQDPGQSARPRHARGDAARPGHDHEDRRAGRAVDRLDRRRDGRRRGSGPVVVFAAVMKDSLNVGLESSPTSRAIPAFAPEEIERQRQQMVSAMKVSYEDPDFIAGPSSTGWSTGSIPTASRTAARRSR